MAQDKKKSMDDARKARPGSRAEEEKTSAQKSSGKVAPAASKTETPSSKKSR